MNNKTKRNKNDQIHCRADETFCNGLDKFITSNELNKSKFIREAIQEKMDRTNNPNYDALLTDNSLHNFLVRKSISCPTCKNLLKEHERILSK